MAAANRKDVRGKGVATWIAVVTCGNIVSPAAALAALGIALSCCVVCNLVSELSCPDEHQTTHCGCTLLAQSCPLRRAQSTGTLFLASSSTEQP